MTDLSHVLPNFPVGQFAKLLPVLERHDISTCDLLTLEAADIGKRTRLPLLDIRRLSTAILDALHADLGVSDGPGDQPAESAPSRPGAGLGPDSASASASASGSRPGHAPAHPGLGPGRPRPWAPPLKNTPSSLASQWRTISTLDPALDRALGGGIPVGSITEITGESGSGKTQFLLTLLLSVQLPPPHGLGRPALYISTEAPLSTRRLAQMLATNPFLQTLPPNQRPSLDLILSTVTPDLESQDHIINFQVPVEVERRGIGLIVLDSVAANYRAEFDRGGAAKDSSRHSSNMGARAAELLKLGMHLRVLAQRYNLAVVVSNQVSDRFVSDNLAVSGLGGGGGGSAVLAPTPASSLHRPPPLPGQALRQTQESPLASRTRPLLQQHSTTTTTNHDPNPREEDHSSHSPPPQQQQAAPTVAAATEEAVAPPPPPNSNPPTVAPSHPLHSHLLNLDHQQRFFTGWGDDEPSLLYLSSSPSFSTPSLKTPSLGLVWTTQLAARIVLFRRRRVGRISRSESGSAQLVASTTTWQRHMKVVFAAHAPESGPGLKGAVEFEVWNGGVRAVDGGNGSSRSGGEEGRGGEGEEGDARGRAQLGYGEEQGDDDGDDGNGEVEEEGEGRRKRLRVDHEEDD
ncbi:hypothetical protein VTJ04DRAFT_8958 [Mycothermus thermophilus]|uniref:uncharacterized protein n=1 Tax=Humicola insolens TaxID=85995 RepID=UPI003742C786